MENKNQNYLLSLSKKEIFEIQIIFFVLFVFLIFGGFVGYIKYDFCCSTIVMMYVFCFFGGALVSIFYRIKKIFH